MKKVILLGAISPFCDLVWEIEKLDLEPIICDYYVDAPAKRMGHQSFDISTTDEENLIKISVENKIEGVVSAFSDRNLIPALNLCEHTGANYFFSKDIITKLTDKQLMKTFFHNMGMPIVKHKIVKKNELDAALKDFTFPVVAKPIDAYGSKGIFICDDLSEVSKVYDQTIKESLKYTEEIIVEEYYKADEISISAWVKNGRAFITCIYDVFRNTTNNIELSAVAFPSKYSFLNMSKFVELVNRIVHECRISDGPVTLQCFIGRDGIKISELLCRLAGGSPYLYAIYMGGPNIARMMIQHLANLPIDYQNLESFIPLSDNNEVYYDIQVFISDGGRITYSIDQNELMRKMPEIIDCRIYYQDGVELVNVGSNGVQFAKIICKCARNRDYLELIDELEQYIRVYNISGKLVSFIRKPEYLDVVTKYTIEWDFL